MVIGPNVVIGDGARISNSVLLDSCEIKAHALVKSSIIGWRSTVGRWARMEGTCVTGDDVHIADEIYLNGAKVLPHKSVSANVPEPRIIL